MEGVKLAVVPDGVRETVGGLGVPESERERGPEQVALRLRVPMPLRV